MHRGSPKLQKVNYLHIFIDTNEMTYLSKEYELKCSFKALSTALEYR